jgi:hypothetical protein
MDNDEKPILHREHNALAHATRLAHTQARKHRDGRRTIKGARLVFLRISLRKTLLCHLLHISFCPENELGSSEKCEPGPFCEPIH